MGSRASAEVPDNERTIGVDASGVAVIILTWNQRETTLRCLASLADAGITMSRIVVWDNGSIDETTDSIAEQFPDVVFHRHTENLGVASGRNAAARLASRRLAPTHFLFLDNDMVVTTGFLESLYAPFKHEKDLAQTEAKIRTLEDPRRINAAGGTDVHFCLGRTEPVGYGEVDTGQYDSSRRCLPNGGVMLVRADIFEELDGFDPIFDPYGPEDLDFSFRILKAGYFGLYVPGAVVYHDHHRTFEKGEFGEAYAANKTRHWMVLMRRHATLLQRVGFYLWGAPAGMLRIVWREGLKGNASALKGILKGFTARSDGQSRVDKP